MGPVLDVVLSTGFLAAILGVSTPYVLAALGGLLAERAGVPNIALEGSMLSAACTGALVAGYSGSVWAGAVCGIAAGALLALLLGVLHLYLGADAIIAGIGLNLGGRRDRVHRVRAPRRQGGPAGSTAARCPRSGCR